MSSNHCPECGASVYRSHTHGFKEKFVRAVSSYRAYRCPECGWRGWFGKRRTALNKQRLRTIISLLITLLVTVLLAFYLIEKVIAPAVFIQALPAGV